MFLYDILASTQFISVSYILSSTFYFHHVLELCFLLAFYKNRVLIQGPRVRRFETSLWFEILLPSQGEKALYLHDVMQMIKM